MRWPVTQPIRVRRDGGDRGADVLGVADVAHRDDAAELGAHLLVVAQRAAAEVGAGGAGRDGVDGDPARAELLGEVAGPHLDGALGAGVDGVGRSRR